MKQIKYINCFGTSYTAGGGYEFGHRSEYDYVSLIGGEIEGNHLKNESTRKYPNEEQTRFNFSWPGQLQKILKTNNSDIVVTNLAKSGYGDERLFRKTHEIINSKGFNKDEHIFLFEFAMGPGRRELWSNTLNDYIITNFKFNEDKNMTLHLHGAANDYFYDDIKTKDTLEEFSNNTLHPFYKETISFKNQLEIEKRNVDFFFSYLKHTDINFMFTQEPGYTSISSFQDLHFIDFKENDLNFVNYYNDLNLTIKFDTNGKCDDGHMGMTGAKKVSQIIYDRLVEIYDKTKQI
tara:strand:+ start:464 stop:1339 length:876 start_codon:yes stop_codon:yes gene_type:complete